MTGRPSTLCGHLRCSDRRCRVRPDPPNTPGNPDPAGPCRCCGGLMVPHGASHGGLWAVCARCGTSRWTEAT